MSRTHLRGTRNLTTGEPVPALSGLNVEPWSLGLIDVVHVNHEISARAMVSSIPSAVHPSIPPHLSWLVYNVPDSTFGPFRLVQTRVGCRVGLKPRALLVSAVCDNERAAAHLRAGWGFDVRLGAVMFRRRTDLVEVRVTVDERPILGLEVIDPTMLAGAGVPIAPGLNLAETPHGRQMIQVDPEYIIHSVDRGRLRFTDFDAAAWGDGDIVPTWPISATVIRTEVTLPRLRFLIAPEENAQPETIRLPQAG